MLLTVRPIGIRRDLLKTVTFAVLHFAVGFGVSYAFTGSVVIAGGIALVEPLANTLVYYGHERFWNRVPAAEHGLTASPAAGAHQPT